MKKFLLMLALIVPMLAFTGCGSDDEPKKTIDITVKTDGTKSIQGFNNIKAITPNDFVATIKGNTVYGKHEGTFETKCTSDEGDLNLKVTVEAQHTLYVDLKHFIGAPKAEVEKILGQPTKVNDKGTCTYNPIGLEEDYQVGYTDGKVEMIAIQFKFAYYQSLIDHLSDRYYPSYVKSGSALFIDAYKIEDANYAILLQWNTKYILAAYMPMDVLNSSKTRSVNAMDVNIPDIFNIKK